MTMIDKQAREERGSAQREGVQTLEAPGALDDPYAKIDAGEVQLDGKDGLIQQLITAGLERGLQAELTEDVGHDRGDPEAWLRENSRNGNFVKMVASNSSSSRSSRESVYVCRLALLTRMSKPPSPSTASATSRLHQSGS